jgi:hypothetical protein
MRTGAPAAGGGAGAGTGEGAGDVTTEGAESVDKGARADDCGLAGVALTLAIPDTPEVTGGGEVSSAAAAALIVETVCPAGSG